MIEGVFTMASPARSNVSRETTRSRRRSTGGNCYTRQLGWSQFTILLRIFPAMSDLSDVAPLPSTPSRNEDQEMDVGPSPGGGNYYCIFDSSERYSFKLVLCLAVSELDLNSPLNYGTPSSMSSLRTPRSVGSKGTPMRQRPDVRSDRKLRQVHLGAGEVSKIKLFLMYYYGNYSICFFLFFFCRAI